MIIGALFSRSPKRSPSFQRGSFCSNPESRCLELQLLASFTMLFLIYTTRTSGVLTNFKGLWGQKQGHIIETERMNVECLFI